MSGGTRFLDTRCCCFGSPCGRVSGGLEDTHPLGTQCCWFGSLGARVDGVAVSALRSLRRRTTRLSAGCLRALSAHGDGERGGSVKFFTLGVIRVWTMGKHRWNRQVPWKKGSVGGGTVVSVSDRRYCGTAPVSFWLTRALRSGRPLRRAWICVVEHSCVQRRLALYLAIELLTLKN